MITNRFELELEELKKDIEFMLNNKNLIEEKNISNFLFSLEKHRFNLLDEVRIANSNNKEIEIKSINSQYKVDYHKIFRIYIPEVLPKYKYIGNYTYKNISYNSFFMSFLCTMKLYHKYICVKL